MNTYSRNQIIIGIVVVIILAVLGYFAWKEGKSTAAPGTTATSTPVSINISTSTVTSSTPGYTITRVPISNIQAPNYKTPLTFQAGIDAAEKASYQSQFATVQTTLASNPNDYASWLELGILRKETGDYAGAAADWKYVTEIYPTDPTAFANLGDLYATYLSQPAQGEAYYKQAIKLDPTKEETFYQNLAQIYVSQGDTANAKATLEQGINAKVVGYQNLQTMLNSMQ